MDCVVQEYCVEYDCVVQVDQFGVVGDCWQQGYQYQQYGVEQYVLVCVDYVVGYWQYWYLCVGVVVVVEDCQCLEMWWCLYEDDQVQLQCEGVQFVGDCGLVQYWWNCVGQVVNYDVLWCSVFEVGGVDQCVVD